MNKNKRETHKKRRKFYIMIILIGLFSFILMFVGIFTDYFSLSSDINKYISYLVTAIGMFGWWGYMHETHMLYDAYDQYAIKYEDERLSLITMKANNKANKFLLISFFIFILIAIATDFMSLAYIIAGYIFIQIALKKVVFNILQRKY